MPPWLSFELVRGSLVRKGLEKLRRIWPLVGRKRLYDAAVDIRQYMKKPGEKVTYPIRWDSAKQRKAFFATDAFTIKGKRPKGYVNVHIPTKRTGEYQKGWEVIPTENGYDVGNPLAHAKFIGGTFRSVKVQSRIHRGRWNLAREIYLRVFARLPRKVRESLKLTARQAGFRTSE